eukprot:5748587-Heterocapsa_arctica.AAC.1
MRGVPKALSRPPRFETSLKLLYNDGAPEIVKAGKSLKCHHDTSTPYRSATNGVAERRVRHVLEGTLTLLEQSGMPTGYWPHAADAFCDHINFVIIDGDSAWNKRHRN